MEKRRLRTETSQSASLEPLLDAVLCRLLGNVDAGFYGLNRGTRRCANASGHILRHVNASLHFVQDLTLLITSGSLPSVLVYCCYIEDVGEELKTESGRQNERFQEEENALP